MPAESAAKPVAPTEVSRSAPKSMDRWKCPHCSFIQWSRRAPDFRRHVATHTGSSAQALYLCCGVPFMEAAEHGVPEDVVREQPVWEFEGLFMVGGCRRTFSRKDAYMRHLHRQAGMCFGDAQASYQPGNRARAA
ncbi:hypothetical protein C8T65DRAFT_575349 [Cerioporus squamosus]|nr:hypothetical protein C8T65DRAFT_575349 [Cerioporus squamosus]